MRAQVRALVFVRVGVALRMCSDMRAARTIADLSHRRVRPLSGRYWRTRSYSSWRWSGEFVTPSGATPCASVCCRHRVIDSCSPSTVHVCVHPKLPLRGDFLSEMLPVPPAMEPARRYLPQGLYNPLALFTDLYTSVCVGIFSSTCTPIPASDWIAAEECLHRQRVRPLHVPGRRVCACSGGGE